MIKRAKETLFHALNVLPIIGQLKSYSQRASLLTSALPIKDLTLHDGHHSHQDEKCQKQSKRRPSPRVIATNRFGTLFFEAPNADSMAESHGIAIETPAP
jgi:hypothetical protein